MKTFSQELAGVAERTFQDDILPALKLEAQGMAEDALERLRNKARHEGHTKLEVQVEYNGPYGEEHMDALWKEIRKHLYVDVRVSQDSKKFTFETCEIFRGGEKHYDFPLWDVNLQHCLLTSNYEHVRELPTQTPSTRAFVGILRHFGYNPNYRKVDIKDWKYSTEVYYEILNYLLRWAMEHPEAALKLVSEQDGKSQIKALFEGYGTADSKTKYVQILNKTLKDWRKR